MNLLFLGCQLLLVCLPEGFNSVLILGFQIHNLLVLCLQLGIMLVRAQIVLLFEGLQFRLQVVALLICGFTVLRGLLYSLEVALTLRYLPFILFAQFSVLLLPIAQVGQCPGLRMFLLFLS